MKKYQHRIQQLEYTLQVLGKILDDTNDRIKSNMDKIDELYGDGEGKYVFLDDIPHMRSLEKNEHMKFYIKKEYDRLNEVYLKLLCIDEDE